MDELGRTGRNLMIVERCKNILRIAAVDSVAVAIEHENVHEVRPFIDGAGIGAIALGAALADNPVPGTRLEIKPDFIGVRRPLWKRVAHIQGPNDYFD